MNKNELVDAVAGATGLSKADTARVVEQIMATVISTVSAGRPVRLSDFGTFEPQRRAPRTARNPRTGEQVAVAATRAPRFRPSPAFKKAVAVRS